MADVGGPGSRPGSAGLLHDQAVSAQQLYSASGASRELPQLPTTQQHPAGSHQAAGQLTTAQLLQAPSTLARIAAVRAQLAVPLQARAPAPAPAAGSAFATAVHVAQTTPFRAQLHDLFNARVAASRSTGRQGSGPPSRVGSSSSLLDAAAGMGPDSRPASSNPLQLQSDAGSSIAVAPMQVRPLSLDARARPAGWTASSGEELLAQGIAAGAAPKSSNLPRMGSLEPQPPAYDPPAASSFRRRPSSLSLRINTALNAVSSPTGYSTGSGSPATPAVATPTAAGGAPMVRCLSTGPISAGPSQARRIPRPDLMTQSAGGGYDEAGVLGEAKGIMYMTHPASTGSSMGASQGLGASSVSDGVGSKAKALSFDSPLHGPAT